MCLMTILDCATLSKINAYFTKIIKKTCLIPPWMCYLQFKLNRAVTICNFIRVVFISAWSKFDNNMEKYQANVPQINEPAIEINTW